MSDGLRRRDGMLRCSRELRLVGVEAAQQFLLEIDREIVGRLLDHCLGRTRLRSGTGLKRSIVRSHGRRDRLDGRQYGLFFGFRANRNAGIEPHDLCQFREGIIITKAGKIGDFELVAVCHYLSHTHTQSDATGHPWLAPTSAMWAKGG